MADDLRLEYIGSVDNDNLRFSARSNYTAVTPTLATRRTKGVLKDVYLHCNSDVLVKRGAVNVSKHYAVRRKWRNWLAHLDPADRETRIDGYAIDQGALQLDSGDKPIGEWFDAPGIATGYRQTKFERILSEWVVGAVTSYDATLVDGLGGLYFFVILDLTPTHYRFMMSRAEALTTTHVEETLGAGSGLGPLPAATPYRTEVDVGATQWLARHPTWQDYAALNAALPLPTP
ncbi:hypothetical protein LJR130_007089 [Variovorax sp. LjRoot130]|uniref:hypothetical protein n=1 Tax=Variovorax sp. LjRoot130 TaxID=3342261 RepID=UPI003ED15DD2